MAYTISVTPIALSSNTTSPLATSNDLTYAFLTLVASCLSLLGGSAICMTYIVFKDLRTKGRQILVFLSIADAVLAFGNILGVVWVLCRDGEVLQRSMFYCKLHSALTIFASISAFAWTTIMGLALFFGVVKNNAVLIYSHMKIAHSVSWGIPAIITVFALAFNVIGYDHNLDSASWCWIDPTTPNAVVWQLFTGKVWEIMCYIITCVLYFTTVFYIKKRSKSSAINDQLRAKTDDANRKLLFVPLVFIVCRIWGTVRFLIGNIDHEYATSPQAAWIAPMQGIGDSAQGFVNFIFYVALTETVKKKLRCHQREVSPSTFTTCNKA